MNIGNGEFSYKWIDNWAKLPETDGWAHHGMSVTLDEKIDSNNGVFVNFEK